MLYSYQARDMAGNIFKGLMEADSRTMVVQNLLHQNYVVLDVREEKVRSAARGREINLNALHPVKTRDLAAYTRQLSTMIGAGLPIIRCFSILAEQTQNPNLRKASLDISSDLESGLALWEALRRHKAIFPSMFVYMVRSGEAGGVLDEVLTRLADNLEREEEIKHKVRSASVYPIILLTLAVLVVAFMLTYIMPSFVASFTQAGQELPAYTRFMMGISAFLSSYGLLIIIALLLIAALLMYWGRQDSGRLFFDSLYLKLPLVGKTVNRVVVSRFTRTLGALIGAGVPIVQALEVLEDAVGNKVIGNSIARARASIKEGQPIAAPLRETGVFEPMVTHMIAVGEETGSLDEMLERMAVFYDREVKYAVEAMTSALEPLLIILVGGLIGSIIVAIYLPIFSIIQTVQ
ncbi:MAG: type II secretion system F family protein [Syntrophomonadaceae bacterium]|jgi:type IV pilus assembly protein PilC|nr:type II secretion system F family protein [Syntrophomonadaceae bacterium]